MVFCFVKETYRYLLRYSQRIFLMPVFYQDDDILYCEGCGCYGMAGEFSAQQLQPHLHCAHPVQVEQMQHRHAD